MYCKNCGEMIDDKSTFCQICRTDQTPEIGSDQKTLGKKKSQLPPP